MRRRPLGSALFVLLATLVGGIEIGVGCSATDKPNGFGPGGADTTSSSSTSSSSGKGGAGTGGAGGGTGGLMLLDSGPPDVQPDVPVNPCGTKCGPKELCDVDHVGLDDNCNGVVDEGCPCQSGQAHSCFKGDPSYENVPGCYDGTEKCTENAVWGECVGGVHATPAQNCFANDVSACHPITAVPFQDVHLKDGTGNFSSNAPPNSEVWTVTCPQGVSPCPGVTGMNPADNFKPLQSGEYSVTYSKGNPDGGPPVSCTYPLFVGAPGLRIELQWEHDLGDTGVDLDLHLHQPMSVQPWSISGANQECLWSNCTIDAFTPPVDSNAPDNWFPQNAMPPNPTAWFLNPVITKNTCYYAPRGKGQDWKALGKGCHNPRLDLDNITCDPAVVDVNDDQFCAPENINIDFPPNKQWMRVGVHYYSAHGLTYDVHPVVKLFCDGQLTAQLGDQGYYKSADGGPSAPITFTSADGEGINGNRFWMVADVLFPVKDMCSKSTCLVEPVYSDPINKTPYYTIDMAAEQSYGPPYPPIP